MYLLAVLPHGRAQLCAALRQAGVSETMLPIIMMSGHSEKDLVLQVCAAPEAPKSRGTGSARTTWLHAFSQCRPFNRSRMPSVSSELTRYFTTGVQFWGKRLDGEASRRGRRRDATRTACAPPRMAVTSTVAAANADAHGGARGCFRSPPVQVPFCACRC